MKAPTAEQLLQQTIESYNSSVNDMSKFRLNKRETELFVGMIESHTQAHTKALRERVKELEGALTATLNVARAYDRSRFVDILFESKNSLKK